MGTPPWHTAAGPPVLGPRPSAGGRRRRLPLIISLAAAALVVVIVAGALIRMAGGAGGTAGDAVKGYLEALARGDAQAALAFSSDQPASTELLTDEVLDKQITTWPISDIRILDDTSTPGGIGFAQVHVSAKFGDQTSDVTMTLTRKGDGWKLDHAAIKLDTLGVGADLNQSLQAVTIFGKPITDRLYVFPGWLAWGSSNPNLTVTSKTMLLDQLASWGGSAFVADVKVDLSGTAREAIFEDMRNAFAPCENSRSLRPPGCPVQPDDYSLVEGTASWGPADLGQVEITFFDEYHMEVMFSGTVTVPLTAQSRTGATRTGTITTFLSGTADVRQSPPQVTYR